MTTKKDKPASIQKEYRKVSQLKNWDKNPRNIKEKDFERLKTQIRDLKQYKPLLITDDGIVLGGNMRLRAYRDLGTEEVWVSVVDAPDEETKMRYALSDNDRAGYYDGDMLANLTGEYPDFNWEDYAVDLKEPQTLDDLIKSLTPVEEDDVPEISDEPARSEYGKVYQLGRHRLMCGDATKIEDVEKLMDGQKADIAFTSPPYNVGENARLSFHDKENDNKYKDGYKDDNPEYLKLLLDTTTNQLMFSDYVFVNLQMLANNKREVIEWLYQLKEKYADVIIWNKEYSQPAMANNVMNSDFEFVFCFSNGESNRALGTGNFRSTVSNVYTAPPQRKNDFADLHAATFPVHFPVHFLKHFTKDSGSVLDVFAGTGTTLIAAEQLNKTAYLLELDPKYCDVIRKRYENFINKEDR